MSGVLTHVPLLEPTFKLTEPMRPSPSELTDTLADSYCEGT
jgi:hypothetical protein